MLDENARLRRRVADQTLYRQALPEVTKKSLATARRWAIARDTELLSARVPGRNSQNTSAVPRRVPMGICRVGRIRALDFAQTRPLATLHQYGAGKGSSVSHCGS